MSGRTFATWSSGRRQLRRRARRRQGALGVTLLTAALTGSLLAAPGATAAEDGEPKVATPAISKQAYFTNSAGAAVPDTLVSEFPPGVVCVLRPELCAENSQPIREPVNEFLQDNPPETVPTTPAQPVQPGTMPTGLMGGQPRYASYLHFELPELPEDARFEKVELVLSQSGTSYRSDSPAFREAVEAAVLTAGTRNQEVAQKEFQEALQSEPMRAQTDAPYGIETCMVLGDWQPGENQDWAAQPEVDCIVFAANGQFDDESSTWTFDLTWIVDAWTSEFDPMPNKGLYFGPLAAPNLAFGDRDTSTNAQVSFGGKDAGEAAPKLRYTVMTAAGDSTVIDTPLPPASSSSGSGSTSTSTFSSTGTGSSGSFDTQTFSTTSSPALSSAPAAAPQTAEAPAVAPQTSEQPALAAAATGPVSPWYVWLLVPLGLAGLWLLARSLTAEPAIATERAGAMTRLVEQRRSLRTGAARPLTQV